MDRRTETLSIESEADPDAVVGLLAEANRIPEWAPAFADTVIGDDRSAWRAMKDGRAFDLRVVVSRDSRTVDYLRELAPGREGGAYIRAVPRPGGGSVVIMTLPLLAGVDPANTSAILRDELDALARLAEGS
ncbi:MAG: SRPBCC family protein [Acidimicrobiales bacterium]